MSVAAGDSPLSSSSDDFAAVLDAELDSASDDNAAAEEDDEQQQDDQNDDVAEDDEQQLDDQNNNVAEADEQQEDDQNDDVAEDSRIKRRKVDELEDTIDLQGEKSCKQSEEAPEASLKEDICTHPGIIGGMCVRCGQKMDDESGVAFSYIHKNLRLSNDEVARLRDKDLKNILRHKKLYLILDLDHTLLNSARFIDITTEEEYLRGQRDSLPDALKDSLFRLDFMHMMTKLRPFVHTFLKEASKLFEMYIYTMGERPYALEMARLLDPGDVYFNSRVIAQGDCTQRHQKGLDIVLGQETAVLILDDTEAVWGKHKENLILMERYHFFASSCRHFGFTCKSLSELKSDESEAEGTLANILKVLQRIHSLFFDPDHKDNLMDRDVRQVLKRVRKEVLKGCNVVFSRVFPTAFEAENHPVWKMAEELGARCCREVDSSVTHVVSTDAGTKKSRWAVNENKFLVHPRWIEAANYLWRKQAEENFPVSKAKSSSHA